MHVPLLESIMSPYTNFSDMGVPTKMEFMSTTVYTTLGLVDYIISLTNEQNYNFWCEHSGAPIMCLGAQNTFKVVVDTPKNSR